MSIIETIITAFGLSLDTCALMICKGAVLRELKKKKVLEICLISTIWQAIALMLGNLIPSLPFIHPNESHIKTAFSMLAVLIFMGLAFYMLWKYIHDKPIFEHRAEDFSLKEICLWSWATSQDAFFSGIGFSFLSTSLLTQCFSILLVTVLAVLFGLYSGYHLGFSHKSKAYLIGSLLLMGSGIDVIMHYLL